MGLAEKKLGSQPCMVREASKQRLSAGPGRLTHQGGGSSWMILYRVFSELGVDPLVLVGYANCSNLSFQNV